MWKYSENEATYLINYYSESLIGKLMNGESSLKIDAIEKKKIAEDTFLLSCVSKKQDGNYEANLDEITNQLNLVYPIEVLKLAGLHNE